MPINDSRQKSSSAGAAADNGNNGNNGSGTGTAGGATKKTSRLTGSNLSHQEGNHSSSSSPAKGKRDSGTKPTNSSTMSTLGQYPLIDDDHIDEQETINVGNLIIDLESDLEKDHERKIEHEHASSTRSPSSSTSFAAKPNFLNASQTSTSSGAGSSSKSHHKSSGRGQSNNSGSGPSSVIAGLHGLTQNSHSSSSRAIFRTSSDERNELKLKITREAKPGKSEQKIVTSPNHQKMHTAASASFKDTNEFNAPSPSESSSISSTKECGTSTSIGTITEPDCLGPCEPGTSVTLEGIVWQETDGGILVVNVTWRGKTYVGALLDCTKHDWAPPRLCDSPVSDIDSKTHKSVRTKRIVTRSNGIGVDEKNLLQTTGKLRNGKGRRILAPNELGPCNKKQREGEKSSDAASPPIETNASTTDIVPAAKIDDTDVQMNIDAPIAPNSEQNSGNALVEKSGPDSPMLIGCSEPNCSKKYRNKNGLQYHQTHAHGGDAESDSIQDVKEAQSPNATLKAMNKEDNVAQGQPSSTGEEPLTNRTVRDINLEGRIPFTLEPQTSPRPQRPRSRLHDRSVPLPPPPQPQPQQPPQQPTQHQQPSQYQQPPQHQQPQPQARSVSPQIVAEQPRPQPPRNIEHDRRSSSGSNNNVSIMNTGHKSPGPSRSQQDHERAPKNYQPPKQISNNSRQQLGPPANIPVCTEEGMKPSGTSTGPPPAPHQANYYFNSALIANSLAPYGIPPYMAKPPLPPMYDPLSPQTSSANAFLTRLMSTIRGPTPMPPTSEPPRLMSPSTPKNLPPFPQFRVDPSGLLIPNPPMGNPPLPNLSPLGHPPMTGGSPNMRMPIPGDQLMPPTSLPQLTLPPPPSGMHPSLPGLGLPGPGNPMGLVGPQIPGLVEDPLAKQFPRRFN